MKPFAVILLLSAWCATPSFAQQTNSGVDLSKSLNTYFPADRAWKVTIESANGLLLEFDVTPGVFLSIHVNAEPFEAAEEMAEARHWKGDVFLRMRRYDEIALTESKAGRDIMAKSPLEMNLKDVVVQVAEIQDES